MNIRRRQADQRSSRTRRLPEERRRGMKWSETNMDTRRWWSQPSLGKSLFGLIMTDTSMNTADNGHELLETLGMVTMEARKDTERNECGCDRAQHKQWLRPRQITVGGSCWWNFLHVNRARFSWQRSTYARTRSRSPEDAESWRLQHEPQTPWKTDVCGVERRSLGREKNPRKWCAHRTHRP